MQYVRLAIVLMLGSVTHAQKLALSIPEPTSTHFGLNVVTVGDVNGDGFADFGSGTHRFHGSDGRVSMYSGADGQVIWTRIGGGIGSLVGAPGDVNNDGIPDLTVDNGVYSGSNGDLLLTLSIPELQFFGGILYVGDVNGDGYSDLLVHDAVFSGLDGTAILGLSFSVPFTNFNSFAGAPGDVNGDGVPDILTPDLEGNALLFSGADGSLLRSDAIGCEQDGKPLTAIDDFNGDGELDYVVPGSPIRVLSVATGAEIYTAGDFDALQAAAIGDYNGNGTPDFALIAGLGMGGLSIFEGSNGSLLGSISGVPTFSLDALGDRNGDGLSDLVIGFPFNSFEGNEDVPAGFMGLLRVYESDLGAEAYCSAKLNSLGCSPVIALNGNTCISDSGSMEVLATNILNLKSGLFFYGFASADLPFLGGTLCVLPPLRRTPITFSFGNPPPANDCSGMASFNLKQWIVTGNDASLLPGTDVFLQHWSRDPGSMLPNDVGLTGGLRLTLCP